MSKKRSKKLALLRLAILPVASVVWIPRPARGDTHLYTEGYSVWDTDWPWFDSSNGSVYSWPAGDGVSVAVIGNGGHDIAGATNTNVTYNFTYPSPGIGILYLDSGNTVTQSSSGTALVSGQEDLGLDGAGTYTQSAGTNKITSYLELGCGASGGTALGTYNLSGSGTLTAPTEYIGSLTPGSFSQTGGSNTTGRRYAAF